MSGPSGGWSLQRGFKGLAGWRNPRWLANLRIPRAPLLILLVCVIFLVYGFLASGAVTWGQTSAGRGPETEASIEGGAPGVATRSGNTAPGTANPQWRPSSAAPASQRGTGSGDSITPPLPRNSTSQNLAALRGQAQSMNSLPVSGDQSGSTPSAFSRGISDPFSRHPTGSLGGSEREVTGGSVLASSADSAGSGSAGGGSFTGTGGLQSELTSPQVEGSSAAGGSFGGMSGASRRGNFGGGSAASHGPAADTARSEQSTGLVPSNPAQSTGARSGADPLASASGWAGEGAAARSSFVAGTASVSASSDSAPASASAGASSPSTRTIAGLGYSGSFSLPNDHGQVWREYDISPYTVRVETTKRPEQAIIDWILRETGYEAWHSEVVAVLCATRRRLYVYHTPEMQQAVADIVDRFLASQMEPTSFGLRLVTLSHPNWQTSWQHVLRPVQVQTPAVRAWLVSRDEAVRMTADLRRRSDYREHNAPQVTVNNGQPAVVSATRGRQYVRGILWRPEAWLGFEPDNGFVDEGFSLEFSPLLSSDGQWVDGVVKLEIHQVEKMVPLGLEIPTSAGTMARPRVEVPQRAQFFFHERFRWPVEQVLVVDFGMLPLPLPVDGSPLAALRLPIATGPTRGNVLLFVQYKGRAGTTRQSANLPNYDPSYPLNRR